MPLGGLLPYPDEQPMPQQQGSPGIDDPRYREALSILEEVLRGEPDDEDSAALAKLVADLYKLVANRQKELDDAMAGKMSPRLMRRG